MLLYPSATFAITFSVAAASMIDRSIVSLRRQTSASLPAIRARSSPAGIAASPEYRSTSAAWRSLAMTEEGSLRVTRTFGIGGIGWTGTPSLLLVSVRQAIPAVVAANGRLDEARAVAVAAAQERQQGMTRMGRGPIVRFPNRRRRTEVPGDRLADHRAQFLVIH